MEPSIASILDKYGVSGLAMITIIIGGAWLIRTIIAHFIKQIEKRDIQIERMVNDFSETVRDAFKKIGENTESHQDLNNKLDKLNETVDRNFNRNHEDHERFVAEIRRIAV